MSTKKRDPKSLMKLMGSPDGLYGPLPKDDWLYRMQHCDDADERAMGWIHAHTIDLRHFSPWAVDEHRRALGPKDLRKYTGWDVGFTEAVLLRLEKAGRIRRDIAWDEPSPGRKGRGRIGLCAHVPAAHEQPEADKKSKKKELCTNSLLFSTPYVIKQIQTLPAAKRDKLTAFDAAWFKATPEGLAECTAKYRDQMNIVQFVGYAVLGVKLKQIKREKKKSKRSGIVDVKLNLPDSVQSPLVSEGIDIVQILNQVCTHLFNGSVQSSGAPPSDGTNSQQSDRVTENGPARAFLDSDTDKNLVEVGRSVEGGRTDLPTLPELQTLLKPLGKKLKDTCGKKLLGEIFTALQGAPLADLQARIGARWKSITSFGMVRGLAQDVGDLFVESQRDLAAGAAREKEEIERGLREAELIEQYIEYRKREVDAALKAMGEAAWLDALARHASEVVKQFPKLPKESIRDLAENSIRQELADAVMPFEDWRMSRAAVGGS